MKLDDLRARLRIEEHVPVLEPAVDRTWRMLRDVRSRIWRATGAIAEGECVCSHCGKTIGSRVRRWSFVDPEDERLFGIRLCDSCRCLIEGVATTDAISRSLKVRCDCGAESLHMVRPHRATTKITCPGCGGSADYKP